MHVSRQKINDYAASKPHKSVMSRFKPATLLSGSKVWTKNEEKPCLKTHLLADSGYYTRNPISGNPPLVITIILSCWNQLLLHLSLRIGIYQMYIVLDSTRIMLNYNTAQLIWLLCCHIPYNFIFCLTNHRIEKRER